jgi:hypothetical protein
MCKADGEACVAGFQCCSKACSAGTCGCGMAGKACAFGNQCCSQKCKGGACQP